jgi:signal transduction histidine kinase/DNA-binding response OmpR family regulator
MVLRTHGSKVVLTFLFLVAGSTLASAQNGKLDSLKSLALSSTQSVSNQRIDLINKLSYELRVSYPDLVMYYARQALSLSKRNNYKIGESDANITLGLLYWLTPEIEKSLEHGLRALYLTDSLGYKKGAMEANLLLGLVYNELVDFKKAESFSRSGLDIAMEIGHTEGTARACNTLGNHYRRRGQGKEALQYYQMGLDHLEGKNISIKNLLLNNIALYYINQDVEREKTKQYLDEALQIALAFENKSAEILTHTRLGAFYTNLREFSKAEQHFMKVKNMSVELGNHSALLDVYKGMTDIKTKAGHYQEAQNYKIKYLTLKDSLFSLDNARQVAEMETRFETEKKEQHIKILEQEAVIQNIWTNVLIGGTVLLILISYYIFRLQRSRTRKTKQLLETQELLNDKLKEVDSIKSAFFANISHEFRTPLTLILVPLEEEIRKRSGAEKQPLLLIKRNASRLLELVNQLLDLSRLEAGRMEFQLEKGEILSLLKIISASFDSLAQHKQIHFAKTFDVDSENLWFDKDKVEKIITNLLANAFKFTPAYGTVTFAALLKKTNTTTMLALTVSDTGKGISPQEQELVFSSFYRVQEGEIEGTGLGLSLVRELIKFCGGTIYLRSEINKGSVFTVELPMDKEAVPIEQRKEQAISPPIQESDLMSDNNHSDKREEHDLVQEDGKDSILIVEDNVELRNYIYSILAKKYTVFTASQGEEALQLAVKVIPNLVVSDLMMPNMDGLQLTEKIKADERTSHIPVILLTARNDHTSRLEGLNTGADDYLTKPFSRDELLIRIKNLIHQRKLLAERFRERILVPITSTQEVSLDDKFLHKVRLIIEANMSDVSFSVEQLAETAHLDRNQLLRKLKGLTGLSPNDFIKDLRLKKAADMIRQRTDTITQIAYAVGFNDQSYFSKCFKKQFGVTPKEFSEQHKGLGIRH